LTARRQILPEPVLRVLSLPALALIAFATRPRRRPRLDRITRRPDFEERQAQAVRWVDEHLRQIEDRAPWLVRFGAHVEDACWLDLAQSGWFPSHSNRWGAGCSRNVTVIYGADGRRSAQVEKLAAALYSLGWGYYSYPDPGAQISAHLISAGTASHASWRPRDDVPRPPGSGRAHLPDDHGASVSLLVRTEHRDVPSLTDIPRSGPRPATPFFQPVEMSGDQVSNLAGKALRAHRHAFLIEIRISYYSHTY
jgi:hypothetical protein